MDIKLVNGTIIEGYPREQPTERAEGAPRPDATEQEEEGKLFTDNAFLFLSNARRILADSRMFLAPIHGIKSGIAYTGRISQPTLGAYIEWWLYCFDAMQHKAGRSVSDPDLRPEQETGQWLLFSLAGWPSTVTNYCGMVNVCGERWSGGICGFYGAWRAFAKINRRYDEAKSACQAYTLQEVLDILKAEGRTVDRRVIYIAFLKNKASRFKREVRYYKRLAEEAIEELHEHLVLSRADEIEPALREFEERQNQMRLSIADIDEAHKWLRRRMKAGEMTNVEYQKTWQPLHRLRDRTEYFIYNQQYELRQRFSDVCADIPEMKRILKKHKQRVIGEILGLMKMRKEQ